MIYLEIVGGWIVFSIIVGILLGMALSDNPSIRRRGR